MEHRAEPNNCGWPLFLALALCAWFAPNAGALTRTPAFAATHCHEAVAVGVVVLGDGLLYDAIGNRLTRSVSGTGGFASLTNQSFTFDNSDRLDNDSNNPIDFKDPSGHDFDVVSLMASTSLGVGLDSMYNGTVATIGNSLQGTIMGVQHGYSANQILASYYLDTAIGIGGGFLLGKAIGSVDEVIFGAEVEFSGSTAPNARAAVQETEQSAVEAARQSHLFFVSKKWGQGVDLMLPIDLQQGGCLFSTKAPNTISHGLWATDEIGVTLAEDSVSAYSRGVQIAPGNKTIYAYKIKQQTSGAFGYARANAGPQGSNGKGGFPQYYIRQQDVGNLEPAGQFQFSQ